MLPIRDIFRLGLRHKHYKARYPDETILPSLVLHCHFKKNNVIYTVSKRVAPKLSVEKPPRGEFVINQKELIAKARPNEEVVHHVSAGKAGYTGKRKRANEATFKATARLFEEMQQKGLLSQPIEIVMSDFMPSRQVFIDVLLGREGAKVRPFVKRVTDGTATKFGGDRPPNRPRK